MVIWQVFPVALDCYNGAMFMCTSTFGKGEEKLLHKSYLIIITVILLVFELLAGLSS